MKFLLIFLWSLIFCFNAQAGNKNFSGFKLFGSANINNLSPISEKYKGKTPEINLDNGKDLTIIIFCMNVNKITLGYWSTKGLGSASRQMIIYSGVPLISKIYRLIPKLEKSTEDN